MSKTPRMALMEKLELAHLTRTALDLSAPEVEMLGDLLHEESRRVHELEGALAAYRASTN